MKQLALIAFFITSIITASQPPAQPPINNSQVALQPQVDATSQAIHNSATKDIGSSYWKQCSKDIIVGLSVQVLAFIVLDLYKGSKSTIYRTFMGLNPEEKHLIAQFTNLNLTTEQLHAKIASTHYKNYERYRKIMEENIANAPEEEKMKYKQRLEMSTDMLTRRQELALQNSLRAR